jgi:glutathione S-transferase
MAIQFYSWPQSSGSRVHWALEELGLSYEYKKLDRAKKEHRAAEYLVLNPNGKVPALVDDGLSYFESVAIILHLGEKYGAAKGLWPRPEAGQARADALCWTVWGMTELHNYMMQYMYHGLDSPVSYKPADRSKATADYNFMNLSAHLDMLEARLRGRDFVLGNFSLADVPASSTLLFGQRMGVKIEGREHVAAWLDRCAKRPARAKSE